MKAPDPNYESLKGTSFERPLIASSENDVNKGIFISFLIPVVLNTAAWISIYGFFYGDSVFQKIVLAAYTVANALWNGFLYWHTMDSFAENRRRTRNGEQPWQQER